MWGRGDDDDDVDDYDDQWLLLDEIKRMTLRYKLDSPRMTRLVLSVAT